MSYTPGSSYSLAETHSILDCASDIIKAKTHDYAADPGNAYEAFDFVYKFAELVREYGADETYQPFLTLIAVKLVRIFNLTAPYAPSPKNESLRDTCLDLVNYCALWGGFVLNDMKGRPCQSETGEMSKKSKST
jgi:hypothetical protein